MRANAKRVERYLQRNGQDLSLLNSRALVFAVVVNSQTSLARRQLIQAVAKAIKPRVNFLVVDFNHRDRDGKLVKRLLFTLALFDKLEEKAARNAAHEVTNVSNLHAFDDFSGHAIEGFVCVFFRSWAATPLE